MIERIDAFSAAGLAAFAAGSLLVVYVALEPNESPGSRDANEPAKGSAPTDDEAPGSGHARDNDEARSAGSRSPPSRRPTGGKTSSGGSWVPTTCQECVAANGVAGGLPAADQRCSERTDLIDIGKQVGNEMAEAVRASARMPTAEENALGERLEASLNDVGPFAGKVDRPVDVARYRDYLHAIVNHLGRWSSRRDEVRFRVHIIDDPEFNAFAMPGGVLGVCTGVLHGPHAVRDEAELVAVLGHEIAHVEKRHPVAVYEAVRAVLGPGSDDAAILAEMLRRPIASEYEHASDRRGVELAALASYDPGAASRLWSRLAGAARSGRSNPGGVLGGAIEIADRLIGTHPPSATRCARTRAQAPGEVERAGRQHYYRGPTNLSSCKAGPNDPH